MEGLKKLGICDRSCELIKALNDIVRGLKKLGIDVHEKVVEKAKELAVEVAERELLVSCKPNTVASACLYISSILLGRRLTQRELVDANIEVGLAEPSIKRAYRIIVDELQVGILL